MNIEKEFKEKFCYERMDFDGRNRHHYINPTVVEKPQLIIDWIEQQVSVEPVVMQNADIGIDVCTPERIGWTEFTKESIIFHYSTKDEYENCANTKTTGIKLSVSA